LSFAIGSLIREYLTGKRKTYNFKGIQIRSPRDFAAVLMPLRSPNVETMKVAYLDKHNRVIRFEIISTGLINRALIDIRSLFFDVPTGTVGVVIAHNHPGGNPSPSREDTELTVGIKTSVDMLGGVIIYDHVITDGGQYYSFAESGTTQLRGIPPTKKTVGIPAPEMMSKADWELLRRDELQKISNPDELNAIFKALRQSEDEQKNSIYVLYTSNKNRLLAIEKISADTPPVEIRKQIVKTAIEETATNFFSWQETETKIFSGENVGRDRLRRR
jgi:DNA repair protein RadC